MLFLHSENFDRQNNIYIIHKNTSHVIKECIVKKADMHKNNAYLNNPVNFLLILKLFV